MKYLTALLIPSVVHGSAPRRKFISREVGRERKRHASAQAHAFPDRQLSNSPIYPFGSPPPVPVSLQVTARIPVRRGRARCEPSNICRNVPVIATALKLSIYRYDSFPDRFIN